jgi:lysine 2,3-aminomutase
MLHCPRDREEIPLWRGATAEEWSDWRWQLSHRVSTAEELGRVVSLTPDEERALAAGRGLFRLGVTPHYATLVDPDDPACPLRLQVVPRGGELVVADFEARDPLAEDAASPVPGLVHRYPDRVLLLLTHECALYCRYCTRRRIVGDQEAVSTPMLEAALEYVRCTPAVRDVLLSGGDPLSLSDRRLEWVVSRLREIPHVEIIRIGSRMPVVLPQRITPELVGMLRKYHPVWLNTHFNHPFELTPPATRQAMERLADAGIPTGNQTVLLRGVNDCPVVMKRLVHELVKLRCRPYYLYNCDLSEGLSHFRTPVSRGLAIIEALRGHTSGYAVPTYVVDAPGGGGKIPLSPDYVVSRSPGRLVVRNFEGRHFTYHDVAQEAPDSGGSCTLCGTDHSAVGPGPAAELWG